MPKGYRINWTSEHERFIRDNYMRMEYAEIATRLGFSAAAVTNKAVRMGLRKGGLKIDPVVRFWSQVRKGEGCWEWTGCIADTGYGRMQYRGRQRGAHRLSYLFEHGSIPPGAFICHHCDNRSCVRPDHLYAGTIRDNARDAVERRRTPWGEANAHAVLTASDVLTIRAAYRNREATMTELGRRYGVNHGTVRHIVEGTTWAHLTGGTPIRKGQRRFGRPRAKDYEPVAVAMFHDGCSMREIREATGKSKTTIGLALRKHGLRYRKPPRTRNVKAAA
jgi:hypothetical protein